MDFGGYIVGCYWINLAQKSDHLHSLTNGYKPPGSIKDRKFLKFQSSGDRFSSLQLGAYRICFLGLN
jgi:hypothetical protein